MNELTGALALKIYEDYLYSAGLKVKTVKGKLGHAGRFFAFLKDTAGKTDVRNVTDKDIRAYILHLVHAPNRTRGGKLGEETRRIMAVAVKQIFGCLYRNEHILYNPAESIKISIRSKESRRVYLSQQELSKFLDNIKDSDLADRDRTIFELVYSSGFRIGEITRLKIDDIDFKNRMVFIRKTKGKKDWIVPVTEISVKLLRKYLGKRIKKKDELVFCGLKIPGIRARFKKWAKQTGVMKKGLCVHSLRHSTAVHLLENGANVRYVQELLGHNSLQTTVRYTYLSLNRIRSVYKTHHPRENTYYREVDEAYREKIRVMVERLREWGGWK